MTSPLIAVIGGGNMGSSLIGGLIKDGHSPEKLIASDPDPVKLQALAKNFHIQTTTDNKQAVHAAEVVLLAVKPQYFAAVTKDLAPALPTVKPLIISIAAGIREASIQQWLGGHAAIVRAMPNTPALIGCGATALFANHQVTHDQRNLAESILRAVGVIVWLNDESLMDAVTALSGSGPAYFFLMMEALHEAAIQLGLPDDTAKLLTLQTALGATRMAIESGQSLPELRRLVTSPGGTTEKALSVLEEHKLREIFSKALHAAKRRSEELANQ